MGSVFKRPYGFVLKFKDCDGVWKVHSAHQPSKAAAKALLAEFEARVARGFPAVPPVVAPAAPEMTFGALADQWLASLDGEVTHSKSDSKYRLKNHIKPALGKLRLSQVTTARLMTWLDELQQAKDGLASASIRHLLNEVSRVFAYGIERGLVPGNVNPVRLIPTGKRPAGHAQKNRAWLADDADVRRVFAALPEPINLMFYLGNRSGLRPGEIAGLRLSDLEHMEDDHAIRVRFSYGDCLKEDKRREGKVKFAPAPADARAVLGPWLAQRKAETNDPEALVFVTSKSPRWPAGRMLERAAWGVPFRAARLKLKLPTGLDWYGATRHSYVSRSLTRGASLDVVSASIGHSSPEITKQHYDHMLRQSFPADSVLTEGLGLGGQRKGKLLPLKRAR